MEAQKKASFCNRVYQIRSEFYDGANLDFANAIGEAPTTVSNICNGSKNGGLTIAEKILNAIPEIDAKWLLTGKGEMRVNASNVISQNNINGDNMVNGGNIQQGNDNLAQVVLTLTETNSRLCTQNERMNDKVLELIEKLLAK